MLFRSVQMEFQAGIGHIVAVHVKDTKPGVFKNVPFGEGVVDFERCFETLKQSGYCGPYLIGVERNGGRPGGRSSESA